MFLLGMLCRVSRDAGWLGPRMGLPLLVFTLVSFFCWLVWWWTRALDTHEGALRTSEQNLAAVSMDLRRTLETAAAGLTRCSRDLRYTSVNSAYARLLGHVNGSDTLERSAELPVLASCD